jgi:SNF2 family DNA or RNA helicase
MYVIFNKKTWSILFYMYYRQNEVNEFFPLLKFLHIKPLNDWDRFNLLIAKPISKGPGANLAMKRLQVCIYRFSIFSTPLECSLMSACLVQVVLTHVMFRRTKAEVASVLKLPARTVVILPCEFDASEQQFYTALKNNVQTLLKRILAKSEGAVYMNILVLLLRLRQGRFIYLKFCGLFGDRWLFQPVTIHASSWTIIQTRWTISRQSPSTWLQMQIRTWRTTSASLSASSA